MMSICRLPTYLSGSDEHLAVLAVVDGDGVGVVEEVDAAVLAVPHDHLLSCKKRGRRYGDDMRAMMKAFLYLSCSLAVSSIFALYVVWRMEMEGWESPSLFSPPETQMKGYAASGARENMFVFALDASQGDEGRLPALC